MQHIECLKTGTTHRASPPWHIKALCFPSSRDIAVVDPSLGPDRDPLAGRHVERTSQPMSHPVHSSILRRLTLAGHVQPPSPHHTAASIPLSVLTSADMDTAAIFGLVSVTVGNDIDTDIRPS